MPVGSVNIVDADRILVARALRTPRGCYGARRASQLSGIPRRTLDDWAGSGVFIPDWHNAHPRGWSYRDVVLARLLAWLRGKGMDRDVASTHVRGVRDRLETGEVDPTLRSDGTIMLVGGATADELSGQQVFDGLCELLDVFELVEPVEGVSSHELWGPNLVHPSAHTRISPWVLGGEPCVESSRVASSSLHALHVERGLDVRKIGELYPQLGVDAIADAVDLETRLHAA